jgi:hypothetical protein
MGSKAKASQAAAGLGAAPGASSSSPFGEKKALP